MRAHPHTHTNTTSISHHSKHTSNTVTCKTVLKENVYYNSYNSKTLIVNAVAWCAIEFVVVFLVCFGLALRMMHLARWVCTWGWIRIASTRKCVWSRNNRQRNEEWRRSSYMGGRGAVKTRCDVMVECYESHMLPRQWIMTKVLKTYKMKRPKHAKQQCQVGTRKKSASSTNRENNRQLKQLLSVRTKNEKFAIFLLTLSWILIRTFWACDFRCYNTIEIQNKREREKNNFRR